MDLLLGCGKRRNRIIQVQGRSEWKDLQTLDCYPECEPDWVWGLEKRPWPFEDDTFDEVHAYEVLEHLGSQGDFRAFFDDFHEIWRILKPGGFLAATVPSLSSPWLLGEPSHRRVVSRETLTFLSQEQYEKQVGTTAMSDFRWYWKGDLPMVWDSVEGDTYAFVLQALK